ncbi:MAG: hypothetical protein N2201_05305, partial [candidate division WOR-3 bacterium]|nr:hypothetical protein [candidate division WOR-3 bacterium]
MKPFKVFAVLFFISLLTYALAQPSYDLDIADNLGNLVGNTMTLSISPGNSGTGQFWLVNPSANNNVDPDPYGNQPLNNIRYITNDLNHLTYWTVWIPASYITINLTPIPFSLSNGSA